MPDGRTVSLTLERSRKAGFFLILLVVALFAMLLGAVGTWHGAGLTPDTLLYLDTADLLRSTGSYPLELLDGRRSTVEIAPLYPLVLAAVGAGVDNPEPSRWLNIVLYGLNVWVFGLLLLRLTKSDTTLSIAGACLAATSLVMLEIHTASWTEPLFLLLQMSWLWVLGSYLEQPGWGRAAAVGMLVGLSPVCRLAGVTSLVAAALTLLWKGRKSWRHWPLILVCSVTPLWLMLSWNKARQGGSGAGGGPLHIFWPAEDIVVLWNTIAAWIVPGIDRFQVFPGQDIVALLAALGWLALLVWGARQHRELGGEGLYSAAVMHSLAYPLTVLGLIMTVKPDLPMEQRIMMPMHITVLMVTLAQLSRHKTRRLWLGLVGLWLLVYLAPALVGVRLMATKGRGYLSPAYQAPEIYKYLRENPPTVLHTNEPTVTWMYLRRHSSSLERPAKGPLLFFRVDHPLPPRHEAGVKRAGVPRDELTRIIEDTPMEKFRQQGSVELYLPITEASKRPTDQPRALQ